MTSRCRRWDWPRPPPADAACPTKAAARISGLGRRIGDTVHRRQRWLIEVSDCSSTWRRIDVSDVPFISAMAR